MISKINTIHHFFIGRDPLTCYFAPVTPRPHDALFKSGFADPAHIPGLYCGRYPIEICDHIDWTSLRPEPASFVDVQLDDGHGDLLFCGQLRLGDAEPLRVYLLIEHQSTCDPDMALRIHTYLDRIYERQRSQKIRPLAHVLPLIVTHASGGWTGPCGFGELFAPPAERIAAGHLTPQFEVMVLDLTTMTNEDLDALDLADFPKLVLWLLRDGRPGTALHANLESYWAPTMARAFASPGGEANVSRLINYVGEVTDELIYNQFCATIGARVPGTERLIMTYAEAMRREGRLEASRNLLETQLTLKFGPIGSEHRELLANSTEGQLNLYAQRVLTAETLESVFVQPSASESLERSV